MVLEKGDVVLTGTPKGVGVVRGGDVVVAGVRGGGMEGEGGLEGRGGGMEGEGREGREGLKEVEEGRVQVEVRDREGGWDWGVEE